MPDVCADVSVCILDNFIYVAGGMKTKKQKSNMFFRLDANSQQIEVLPEMMETCSSTHKLVCVGEKIYVLNILDYSNIRYT